MPRIRQHDAIPFAGVLTLAHRSSKYKLILPSECPGVCSTRASYFPQRIVSPSSVATQRSWNAQDEWSSETEWHRVCIFRPRLAEYVATAIKKGSHVLVEGSLISAAYEREVGKGKKAKTTKQTFWCIRADVVRKLDRGEPEPETVVCGSNASSEIAQTSADAPF